MSPTRFLCAISLTAILGFEPRRAIPNGLANRRDGPGYAILPICSIYVFKLIWETYYMKHCYVMKMSSEFSKFFDIQKQFDTLVDSQTYKNMADKVVDDVKKYNELYVEMKENDLLGNPLYVSQLSDKYTELYQKVMRYEVDELLAPLLDVFEFHFPVEASQIRRFWTVYSFARCARQKHILLKGDIQSGKTAMMILTCLCYLVCKRDVIVVLRTSNDDKLQFLDRFREIVEKITLSGYTNPNFQAFDITNKSNCCTPHSACFVSIYQVTKLTKLIGMIRSKKGEFVLYVDEADQRDDLKDTKFKQLRDLSNISIFVSGTVQDILPSQWSIFGKNVVQMTPSNDYKGVENIMWNTDWDISTKEGIYWSLCDIANDTEYSEHPKIILVTTSVKLSEIDHSYREFTSNVFLDDSKEELIIPETLKNSCVIKYADTSGITMYHNSFGKKTSREPIKKVLLWLAQNGGVDLFPNIIILAGKKADRGINFACYDPHNIKNNWHVTHQVLYKSKSSNTSNLLQSLRILGKFTDNIPLKVFTTKEIKESIEKSYKLTEKILSSISNPEDDYFQGEFTETTTDIICKNIPIREKSIPSRYIKKSISDSFKIVSNNEDGIGIDIEYVDIDIPEKGWLTFRNEHHKIIYQDIEEILRENYHTNVWVKRKTLEIFLSRKYNGVRPWDKRKLSDMKSTNRYDSNIEFRKELYGRKEIEYRLVE